MQIKRFIVGMLEANCYIIYQRYSRECYVIDPGSDHEKIAKFIRQEGLQLKAIILTHGHIDHFGGVKKLQELIPCPVYLNIADVHNYRFKIDGNLEDGQTLDLAGEKIKVAVCDKFSETVKIVGRGAADGVSGQFVDGSCKSPAGYGKRKTAEGAC